MTTAAEARPARHIYVDTHVHVYDGFDLDRLWSTALARSRELGGPLVLLLTETDGVDVFERLRARARPRRGRRDAEQPTPRDAAPRAEGGAVALSLTAEPESLALGCPSESEPRVWIIAGRQLVSAEGLEILALAHLGAQAPELASGVPARQLARALVEAGALTVLPWGVGKWLGARARLVDELVAERALRDSPRFFVGDIAHRFRPLPEPRAFRRGVRVLRGTDLLPIRGAETRLASYGSRIAGDLDPEHPARSLVALLESAETIASFGRRTPLRDVVREQLAYRRARKTRLLSGGAQNGSRPMAR